MIKRTITLFLAIIMVLGVTPVFAAGVGDFNELQTISAGEFHTAVILQDGTLWTWGYNSVGQLGDGTTVTRFAPVKVMDDVISVSAGASHTVALKADGSLWAWGSNLFGQLGDGTRVDRLTPVKVMDNVTAVLAGAYFTTAVKEGEKPWVWERTYYSSTDDKSSPDEKLDGIYAISVGGKHTIAIKADGTLWAWGENKYGQLGDGTIVNKVSPVKILDGVRLPSMRITAIPTAASVIVDGNSVAFGAYNIDGSNYFKLRDLAYVLNGTNKRFSVEWDGAAVAISITGGAEYTPVGGEMESTGAGIKTPKTTDARIILGGNNITATAYNIDGNNYFKLRDIAAALDFAVDWDAENNTIVIDTNRGYAAE